MISSHNVIPTKYADAVGFALSDDKAFTFGRPYKSLDDIGKIMVNGYLFKRKNMAGIDYIESVGKKFWRLGNEPLETFRRMSLQSLGNKYYAVFALPSPAIDDVLDEILELQNDGNTHFVLDKYVQDKRKWWVPSVDTIISEQGYLLYPHNIKGHIDMSTGKHHPNNDFVLDDY